MWNLGIASEFVCVFFFILCFVAFHLFVIFCAVNQHPAGIIYWLAGRSDIKTAFKFYGLFLVGPLVIVSYGPILFVRRQIKQDNCGLCLLVHLLSSLLVSTLIQLIDKAFEYSTSSSSLRRGTFA